MNIDPNGMLRQLEILVMEYAQSRKFEVARGTETPRLAATLLRQYGEALADAASFLGAPVEVASGLRRMIDQQSTDIDPQWLRHQWERQAAKRADLVISQVTG